MAGDFNFEESNAKFHRDDIASEIAKLRVSDHDASGLDAAGHPAIDAHAPHIAGTGASADRPAEAIGSAGEAQDEDDFAFYDKKSFFDDISCEAKERIEKMSGG